MSHTGTPLFKILDPPLVLVPIVNKHDTIPQNNAIRFVKLQITSLIWNHGLPTIQFWLLTVCKIGRGSLGAFITWIMSMHVYLGRQRKGGAPNWILNPEQWAASFCFTNMWDFSTYWRIVLKIVLLVLVPLPLCLYLSKHWCDECSKAFPSMFHTMSNQQPNNWEGLTINNHVVNPFTGFSVGSCINGKYQLPDVSTACFSRHQGKSE